MIFHIKIDTVEPTLHMSKPSTPDSGAAQARESMASEGTLKATLSRKRRFQLFILLCILVTMACANSVCLNLMNMTPEQMWVYLPYSVPAFIVNFGFWASFLLLCARSRIAAYILLPIVVITQASVIFAGMTYGVECKEMAIAILNTTGTEVLNYTDVFSVLMLIAGVAVVYGIAYVARKLLDFPQSKRAHYTQLLAGAMGCAAFLALPQIVKHHWHWGATESVGFVDTLEPFRRTWPVPQTREQVLHEAVYNHDHFVFDKAYQPINLVVDYYKAVYDFYNPPALEAAEDAPSEQIWATLPQTVVLYIGESTRADHFPLNGYHRNTMPGIIQEQNLINLPGLYSRETQTISSIYSILSLTNAETGEPTHNSFIGILKKHGYALKLLVGANTEGMWYNAPSIAPLLADRMPLHSRPANAEEYAATMQEFHATQAPHFVLIEDGAGHQPYYSESEVKPFGEEKEIDRYDNTMLDVDRRLCAILDTMRDKEALLFFTADHGESFGENDRWGHGGPRYATEQRHVCAFIWYSDLYAQNHPEVIEGLKKNAHNFTSHDQLYHTIISLCGIKSDVQIEEQDMTK